MNPWTIGTLADARAREMHIRAEAYRTRHSRSGRGASPAAARWPALRRRVGLGLVEAGLHVLATTRPAP